MNTALYFTTQSKGVPTQGGRDIYSSAKQKLMHMEELGRKENVVPRCVTIRLKDVHGVRGEKGLSAGVWVPLDVCI